MPGAIGGGVVFGSVLFSFLSDLDEHFAARFSARTGSDALHSIRRGDRGRQVE